ncbi:NUDIX domain-containing protein [Polymorphospora sp. NPDC050346]|uniref:NUDIX domain-containing protein n=1 Tax=Polymorphospora sp. NPDC050346 TaxID=3155780 RepID=UPI0034031FEF
MAENSRTFTHPDVFAAAARGESWAEPITDPTQIDWPARQSQALIPFEVVDGRPVNPCERTSVRYGRGRLGRWGEQVAADALVTVTDPDGNRWILMVERGDGFGWALPGGKRDQGEAIADTARRELSEETGLDLATVAVRSWQVGQPRYVPDPRGTAEAWMVTVLVTFDLGDLAVPPVVVGADDANRAEWVRADTYPVLTSWLATRYGGRVFAAHEAMLAEALA